MPWLVLQVFGEPATDLIEDQSDQRFGSGDVGWRHDQVEARRFFFVGKVFDAPVAAAGHCRDHGITVQAQK